jgi:hypothetical protein
LGVGELVGISTLEINSAPLETLDRLKGSNLETLRLFYLRKLRSIAGVSGAPQLRALAIVGCRNVIDFDTLRLPALTSIALHQCGEIRGLEFLGGSPLVRDVDIFRTTIRDGDLTVLTSAQLGRVRVRPFKAHYHPPRQEVERGVYRPLIETES